MELQAKLQSDGHSLYNSLDITPCKFSNNEPNYILHHKVALWLSLTGSTSTLCVPTLYVYVNPCQQQPYLPDKYDLN